MPEKVHDQMYSVIQAALPAVCTIYVHTRRGSWSGSGSHIGSGVIITASHVCGPDTKGEQILVTFDDQIVYNCELLISDPNVDAAAIKIIVDWSKIPSIVLGNSDSVEVGDECALLGAPELFSGTSFVGRISNVHQSLGDSAPSSAWNDVIIVDADSAQGLSGGPCITTDSLCIGILMGQTGSTAQYGSGLSSLCPSKKIIEMLRSLKQI